MTRRQNSIFRSIFRTLGPSPVSLAAAAALYDPEWLLHLQATQR